MLTPSQAKLVLSHCEPLVMDDRYPRPVVNTHLCITDSMLQRLGLTPEHLDDYAGTWYDGTEGVTRDGQEVTVHVVQKAGLERASGMSWSDYEQARRDLQAVIEVGG